MSTATVDASVAARPRRRRLLVGALAVALLVVLGAGIAAAALVAWDAQYEGRVLPGVHVGTLDVSGLDRPGAAAAIRAAYPYGDGRVVLHTPDGDREIPFAAIGRRVEVDALVDAAMASGRLPSLVDRVGAQLRQAMDGTELGAVPVFDEAALATAVRAAVAPLAREPVDATIAMGPDGVVVTPSREGRSVDVDAVTAASSAAVRDAGRAHEVAVAVPTTAVVPTRTDIAADMARIRAARIVHDVTVAFGGKTWKIPAATIRTWISFAWQPDGSVVPVVDQAHIGATLAKPARFVLRPAIAASFLRSRSGRIVGVVASRDGRALDMDATVARVAAELERRSGGGPGNRVGIALTNLAPALTTNEAAKHAPVMKRLGGWTTYFPISERNFFGANIWRPAQLIDGTVLQPGETFDWWNAIWPVTTARGFGPGGVIRSDHTDPTGALGGGMCSSSTTLFNAAMRAGLQMGARSNHKYYINRYPLGLDATVSITGGGRQTMTFTNDMRTPVVIRAFKIRHGSSGYVRYQIWGVPDGRTVSLTKPSVSNVRIATTNTVIVSTLPHGVRNQVEYPSNGMDVAVSRVVRNAAGRVIHADTWRSHYVLWNGRIEVGR
jgi:vancomycin resistance protein YoaR